MSRQARDGRIGTTGNTNTTLPSHLTWNGTGTLQNKNKSADARPAQRDKGLGRSGKSSPMG